MKELRVARSLYEALLADLERPHAFAAERIGFVVVRQVNVSADAALFLLSEFISVPDEHYIDDPRVGARIGTEALTLASHRIYHGRLRGEGVFHVHLHGHGGEPGMSRTDARELPTLIPGFQSVGPGAPHGVIIWSLDHAAVWVGLPGEKNPVRIDKVSVVGSPVSIFKKRDS
jgi:hypothetical protein